MIILSIISFKYNNNLTLWLVFIEMGNHLGKRSTDMLLVKL